MLLAFVKNGLFRGFMIYGDTAGGQQMLKIKCIIFTIEKVVFCVEHRDGHKKKVSGPQLLLSTFQFQWGLLLFKAQTAIFSDGQN